MIIRLPRTEKQQYIIDEALSGRWDCICVSAGLGFGKTHNAIDLAVTFAAKYPRTKNCIAGPTYPQLFNSNFMEFESMLDFCRIRRTWRATERLLLLSNHTKFIFQTMEVPTNRLKGPEYYLVEEDEADLIDREHHERLTDRGGRNVRIDAPSVCVAYANSVTKAHWIAEDYMGTDGNPPKERHLLIQGSTYDNKPFLRPTYIAKLEKRYPPGTIGHRRWMKGDTGLPEVGAVFSEFEAANDIVDENALPNAGGYITAMYMGDGPRPTVVLVARVTARGTLVLVNEWVGHSTSRAANVEAARKIATHGGRTKILAGPRAEDLNADYTKMGLNIVVGADLGDPHILQTAITTMRDRLADNRLKIMRRRSGEVAAPYLAGNFEKWVYTEDGSGKVVDLHNESMLCLLQMIMELDRPNTMNHANVDNVREVFREPARSR